MSEALHYFITKGMLDPIISSYKVTTNISVTYYRITTIPCEHYLQYWRSFWQIKHHPLILFLIIFCPLVFLISVISFWCWDQDLIFLGFAFQFLSSIRMQKMLLFALKPLRLKYNNLSYAACFWQLLHSLLFKVCFWKFKM